MPDFFSRYLIFLSSVPPKCPFRCPVALTRGASLTLTSMGRYLPGQAYVKHKIKRIDRLLGHSALQADIPLLFRQLIAKLTRSLSLCVIAVDWSGYPTKKHHILRASLLCDGRSLPLLSRIVPIEKQFNRQVQTEFLDELYRGIGADKKVIIVTDAGFKRPWFFKINALGWIFVGRVRNGVQFQLEKEKIWRISTELIANSRAECLGAGLLGRKSTSCPGYFYLHKKAAKGRVKNKGRTAKQKWTYEKVSKEKRASAREPGLLFTNTSEFSSVKIMKLYSRRMQIEQNFRDEKSEQFGFGLRTSNSKTIGRLEVLCLLATLATLVLWLLGFYFEKRGFHLRYQSNSIKSRRVISFLTLAKNVLRHSPFLLKQIILTPILALFSARYDDMIWVY